MIKRVVVYETDGKQFHTLKAAVDHRENLVEKFFRVTAGFYEIPPKLRLQFVQSILDRRGELSDLLSYTAPDEDE